MSRKESPYRIPFDPNQPPGPLGQLLEARFKHSSLVHKLLTREKDIIVNTPNHEPIWIVVDYFRYLGPTVTIGKRDKRLSFGTGLIELHLEDVAVGNKATMGTMMHYYSSAKSALREASQTMQPMRASYVLAASNERLIQVLMHMVPGFEIVDYLPPGWRQLRVIGLAYHHSSSLGRSIKDLTFPVVAIPKSDFIRQVA